MSVDERPDSHERPDEVIDEEGSVDKAIKRRIIQARERVDETELALYRDAAVDPQIDIGENEKVHIYGTTVKQFLRRIEPILRAEKLEEADHYYEEIVIDEFTLIPPDTGGYPFSLVADDDRSDDEIRQMIGLPRGAELPEPRAVTIKGLKDVIERDTVIAEQWRVYTDTKGSRPNWDWETPTVRRALPKNVYEEAMRKADAFLQSAGIGVEIGSDPHGFT